MRELRFPPCAAVLASHLAPQPVGGLAKPCRRSEPGKNSRRPHIAAMLKMNPKLGQYTVNVIFTLLLWAASTAILGAIARVMFSIAAFGWHMLD